MTKRTRISDLVEKEISRIESEYQDFLNGVQGGFFLDVLMGSIRDFLSQYVPRQLARLYGRKSPILAVFWGRYQRMYEQAVSLSQREDDVMGSEIAEMLVRLRKIYKYAKIREKKLSKHETISHKVLPWGGFRVVLQDIPQAKAEAMLLFLQDMFTHFYERGLKIVVAESIKEIRIMANPQTARQRRFGPLDALYQDKRIDLYDTLLDNKYELKDKNAVMYALTHEIGHWVHLDFITDEARAFWDKPWEGIDTEHPEYSPYHHPQLEGLRIPTNYGLTNVMEDFAETFAWFVIDPDSLDPFARNRMKVALEMSAKGGKSFIRLGRSIDTMSYSHRFLVNAHERN